MTSSGPKKVIDFVYREVELISETLERRLGIWSVVIISLSAMLGSGLFVLPALAMLDLGGPGIWAAYFVAALVVLPGLLSKAELSTAMPVSGGDYIYIERTYGPLMGTVAGLGLWASFLLKAAFALIGFSAYLWVIEPYIGITINIEIAAIALLLLIVIVNILGVKLIKKVQTPIVALSVIFLVTISIWAALTNEPDWSKPISEGAFGGSIFSLAETAAFVFVSYAGVTKIAAVAEEVEMPEINLPRGMLFSLLISTVLYCGILYVMMATIDAESFISDGHAREDPIFVFANAVGGDIVGIIAAILAILTMTSMALAGIMAASRYLFAMARDNLLPESLEDVHPKFETPHWSIIGTGIAMCLAILLLPVHDVAKLASGFQIMIFVVINSCVIVMRMASKSFSSYKPQYKSPLYPFTQIIGILGGVLLIYVMGSKAVIGAASCSILGLITYYTYGKSRAHPTLTPWRTVRTEFTDADQHEREKRWLVFHACCDQKHPGHLTLYEFARAMNILAPELKHFHVRNLFHEIDLNQDGVIDVDEFLESLENGKLEQEE
ncbi:MAG TPA: amino acid permease [Candidatus Thalassarchaeaceae archaeon]|nr:amino acid permease [Candidatus Thalassarchaeaceae archaeon]DAC50965.1 MAG TPA: amino acid permease [Candidatus Poseidoniales archaeon]HIH82804.1 amino acid permease [Candidatus Thalassarchaeaceae archaeon]|tara:strand:- start:835 stop:2493 length:1659 start_codon:yes stop_codon:yes gene_type:complete